jgi:hypothetical protein
MVTPAHPSDPKPKGLNPLWIISAFLGISQVTVTAATTQATGWIQGLLAIFSVSFPVLIAIAFFFTMWRRPGVLYAPRDYGGDVDVRSYVRTLQSYSVKTAETAQAAMKESIAAIVESAGDLGSTRLLSGSCNTLVKISSFGTK